MAASSAKTGLPVIAFANRLPVRRVRNTWRLSDGGLVTALRPAMKSRGGVWVGWDGGIETPREVEGLEIELRPVSLTRREVDDVLPRVCQPHALAAAARPGRMADLRPLLVGRLPVRQRPVRGGGRSERRRLSLGARLPPVAAARAAPAGGSARAASASSCTCRSRRPRCSRGCRGARPCSRACSAPRSSRSTPPATATTSCARAGSSSTASRSTARPSSSRTGAWSGRPRTRSRSMPATSPSGRAGPASTGRSRACASSSRPAPAARRRPPRLHQGHPRAPARDRAAPRAAARPPPRDHVRPGRRAEPGRDSRVPRAARGRRAARRQDQRPLHRAGLDVPVHYLYRGVTPDRLLAYYRAAEICLVTPLQDGMNLVAKEYVTVQQATDGAGVLVLSEFTGAVEELPEALPCNPFDLEGLAGTISLALELDEDDRRSRLARMAATIHRHDVFAWLDQELKPAPRAAAARRSRRSALPLAEGSDDRAGKRIGLGRRHRIRIGAGHRIRPRQVRLWSGRQLCVHAHRVPRAGRPETAEPGSPRCFVQRPEEEHGTEPTPRQGGEMPPRGVKKGHEARSSVRAHQGVVARAWILGGRGRGDRRPHRQQGTRAPRGGEGAVPALAGGHLLRATGRSPLSPALAPRAHERPAVRGSQVDGHQGPVDDEQGAARARGFAQALVAGLEPEEKR